MRGQASGAPKSSGRKGSRGGRKQASRSAALYRNFEQGRADEWLRELQAQEQSPNHEQLKTTFSVIQRCALEAREERRDEINADLAEPSREMVHGLPGAGKSRVIHWIKDFFINVLGWEHGVEFVTLASQNTMAALVGGRTLHS